MSEGIRFDLAYETMPWHKVDAVVFDIGNVLIRFHAQELLADLFPDDKEMQRHMLRTVYQGPLWPMLDRGVLTCQEAAAQVQQAYGGSYADYLHAFTGWFELKSPLEEGWRAVRRCRRAGKKLYLLTNYPAQGYIRLRERFADRFDLFDGDVVSSRLQLMKPEPEIYQSLIDSCGIDPARTLFIDDVQANVEGAMRMGIHGFHMHESGMMDRFFL